MQRNITAPDVAWPVLGLFAILLFIACLPIMLAPVPLLNDYPQHIARIYILATRDSSPLLQAYYVPDWGFQANLAVEAILMPLSRFFPVEIAGRIFLGLIVFFTASSVLFLHWIGHRRWSFWPLLAFLFLYNRVFLGGLIGYLLTLGLAIWALGIWIALRERSVTVRVLVSVPMSILLMLGHLGGLAVYAFAVIGYELQQHFARRDYWYRPSISAIVATLSQFVVAGGIFLLASQTSGHARDLRFQFAQKLTAPFNLFYNYHFSFDAFCFVLLIAIVVVGIARGWITIQWPLACSAIAVVLAYAVMPYVMFGSHGADRRLTVAIALIGIAASDWRPDLLRRPAFIMGLIGLMFVVRMTLIQTAWQSAQTTYRSYLQAIDQLPEGARLGVLIAHSSTETVENPPVEFVAEYAIIRRKAFVPTTFTIPGGQPLRFSPGYGPIAGRLQSMYGPSDLRELRNLGPSDQGPYRHERIAPYDYLLVIHGEDFPQRPPDWLAPVSDGPGFQLFKVARH